MAFAKSVSTAFILLTLSSMPVPLSALELGIRRGMSVPPAALEEDVRRGAHQSIHKYQSLEDEKLTSLSFIFKKSKTATFRDPGAVCARFSGAGCITDNPNQARIYYEEYVPKEMQVKMTHEVCWNFCRTVAGTWGFGLEKGSKCFCSPYVDSAGTSEACSEACPGNATQMCGGGSSVSMFRMHDCDLGAIKCLMAPPSVSNAKVIDSSAYGEPTPCLNYASVHGDNRRHTTCEIECEPGYENLHNSIECTGKDNGHGSRWASFTGWAACNPKSCGLPPCVNHARYATAEVLYPYSVQYTCKLGYTLSGVAGESTSFQVNCTTEGKFTKTSECMPIMCGTAPQDSFANLSNSGGLQTFGMLSDYTCNYGYSLTTAPSGGKTYTRTCELSGNFSSAPSCQAISCGPPPTYKNASLKLKGDHPDIVIFKQMLFYSCNPGYSLDARAADGKNDVFNSSCTAEGFFTVAFSSCVRVSCGLPPPVKHAKMVPHEAFIFFQDTVSYTCDIGYTTTGIALEESEFNLTCGNDGKFTSSPKECKPVTCGDAPVVPDADVKSGSGPQYYPDSVPYTCHPGYSLRATDDPSNMTSATFSIGCLATGNFTTSPVCINVNNCKQPFVKHCSYHGKCVDHAIPSGKADDDWHCHCDSGYESISTGSSPRRENCTNINDCPVSGSYAYECGGESIGECVDLINKYRCTCDDGYTEIEVKTSTNTTCVPMSCEAIPDVPHATYTVESSLTKMLKDLFTNTKVKYNESDLLFSSPPVTYQCDKGFTLTGVAGETSSFKVSCEKTGSGVVRSPISACNPVTCGAPPQLKNGNLVDPIDIVELFYAVDPVNRTIKYECEPGYTNDEQGKFVATPSFTVECTASGVITPLQKCIPVECGVPPALKKTLDQPQTKYTFMQTLEYTCAKGHSTDASNNPDAFYFSSTCQYDGTFLPEDNLTGCKPIKCGKPPKVDHATTEKNDSILVYKDIANYNTFRGWTVDGKASGSKTFEIECFPTSEFVETARLLPVMPVECGQPPSAKNARCDRSPRVFEEQVNYSCYYGFSTDEKPVQNANAGFTTVCQDNGEFATITEKCQPVVCSESTLPKQELVNATLLETPAPPFTFTTAAHFKCKPGYSLSGRLNGTVKFDLRCQADGLFFAFPPKCLNNDDCVGSFCGLSGHGKCFDKPEPSGVHFDDYECHCDSGFLPDVVESEKGEKKRYCHNINDCPKDACAPGTCEDLINAYKCHCPTGYFAGPHDYEYDPHAPALRVQGPVNESCHKQFCLPPPGANYMASEVSKLIKFQDVETYKCLEGYSLNGEFGGPTKFEVKCLAGPLLGQPGNLTAITAKCLPVSCGVPPKKSHANRSTAQKVTFGMSVQYTCHPGYSTNEQCGEPFKTFQMTCKADGKLSFNEEAKTSCKAVNAGKPSVPFATYKTDDMHYPEVVPVTCDTGYSVGHFPHGGLRNSFKLMAKADCTIGANVPQPYACVINECGVAAEVQNMITNTSQVVFYKQSVLYTANPGYTVDGTASGQKEIVKPCQADATFKSIDHLLPLKPVSCGSPAGIPHATVSGAVLTYMQSATYTCEYGYSLNGKSSLTNISNRGFLVVCAADGILGPKLGTAFQTSCRAVECGTPPELPHADAITKELVAFPDVAKYKCKPGYSLDGHMAGPTEFSPPCMAYGQFHTEDFECQNMDDCEGNKCGANGDCRDKARPTGVHINDYWCDCHSGFESKVQEENGTSYHICGNIPDCPPGACMPGYCQDLVNDYACHCPDGYYVGENIPKMWPHDCLPLSCGTPPTHVNATFWGGERVYLQMVEYTCKEGYTLDGSPGGLKTFQIKCGLSGSGVNYTKAPECKLITCGEPAPVSFASKNRTHMLYSDVVAYKCDEGYTTTGDCSLNTPHSALFYMTCNSSGSIVNVDKSTVQKQCLPVTAGTPTVTMLPHSLFAEEEMFFPMQQFVTCKLGFSTDPKDPINPQKTKFGLYTTPHCSFQPHPVCQNVSCGVPPPVTHATVPNSEIVFPNAVMYTAQTGYTLDGNASGAKSFDIECTADGSFEGLEQLYPVRCGSPKDLANAVISDDELTFSQTATYKCLEGFSMDGLVAGATNMKFSVTCQATGDFSDPSASCVPVVCGSAPPQPHATLMEDKKYVAFEDASFTCLPGYALNVEGGDTLFQVACQANGTFHVPATCKNIDDCIGETCGGHGACEDLTNPVGVHIKDYICKCDSGYEEKVGNVSRVCTNINDCPPNACDPGSCEDSLNTYLCHCPTGFYAHGSASVNSSCKLQTCEAPVVPHASSAINASKPILSSGPREYVCDTGYSLDGAFHEAPAFNIFCEGNDLNTPKGNIHSYPSCIPVSCGEVESLSHASASTTALVYPEEVRYECHNGYSTLGSCGDDSKSSFIAKCTANGSTVFSDPHHTLCKANFAGIPTEEMLPKTQFAPDQRMSFGMKMAVTCLPGYSTHPYYLHELQDKILEVCNSMPISEFKGQDFSVTLESTTWEGETRENYITMGGEILQTINGSNQSVGTHESFGRLSERFVNRDDIQCPGVGMDIKITYTFGPEFKLKQYHETNMCKYELEVELPTSRCEEVVKKGSAIRKLRSEAFESANVFELVATPECGFHEVPKCTPISCGVAPEIPLASTTNHSEIFFGSSVTYTCPEGYTLSGKAGGEVSFQTKCMSTGRFSAHKKCQPVKCGAAVSLPLTDISSGLKYGTDASSTSKVVRDVVLTYKDQVVYQCLDGYSLTPGNPGKSAPFTLTCESNGQFLGAEKCLPKVCPLANRTHASVLTKSAVFKNSVNFRCNYGFSVTGSPPKSAGDLGYEELCLSNAEVSLSKDCKDINYCLTDDYCGKGGVCVDGLSNYSCDCSTGYKEAEPPISQRPICVEIDECIDWDGNSHCGPYGTCIDGFDNFTCNCSVGYEAKPVPGHPKMQKCKGKVCGSPPDIDNAVRETKLDKVVYPVQVPYRCDDGYSLTGTVDGDTKFKMACQADRTFVGLTESSNYTDKVEKPVCSPVACPPDLPVVMHATVEGGPLFFDSPEATYTCQPGYTTSGVADGPDSFDVGCNPNGQFTDTAECLPVNCGSPPSVEHANFDIADRVLKEQTNYTCEEGYTIDGNADGCPKFSVTCQASGNFTKPSACLPVSCYIPPFFEHANYEPDVKVFNEVFQVTCFAGYNTADKQLSFNVKCLKTGKYEDHSSCQPVSCGKPSKTAHAIPKTPTVEVFYTESSVWDCVEGFSVNGLREGGKQFTKTCDASGKFLEASPSDCKDIDFCSTKPCGLHGSCFDCSMQPGKCKGPAPSLTQSFLQVDSGVPFKSNGQYACMCKKGYEIIEIDGNLKCTEDDCHGKSCGPGGSCIDLSSEGIEDAYSCTCDEGYFLAGEDDAPHCEQVVCSDEPPEYPHAMGTHIYGRLSNGDSVVRAFDSIEFYCNKGYSTDGSVAKEAHTFTVECTAAGLLRNVQTCRLIKCESSQLPVVPNANVTKAHQEEFYEYGDKIEFTCAAGYHLEGGSKSKSKSKSSGKDHGKSVDALPWTIGSATFTVECQANGEFTPPQRCKPRSCGIPPQMENAYSTFAVVHYPDVVLFHCEDGHFTNSRAQSFVVGCGADGKFIAKAFEACYPVQCSDNFVFPQSRRVDCPEHMTLNGHTHGLTFFEEKCTRDGTIWRGGATCQPITYSVSGVVSDAADSFIRLQAANVEITKSPISSKSCAELGWTDKSGLGVRRKGRPRKYGRQMKGKHTRVTRTKGIPGVCGQKKSDCNVGRTSMSAAKTYCSSIGARLCTHMEIHRGETCGSGCGLNDKPVWTSTPCQEGGFLTVRCKDKSSQCTSDDSGYAGRCCADVNTELDSSWETLSLIAGRSGEYLAKLNAGQYLVKASTDGYIADMKELLVQSNIQADPGPADMTLSQVMPPGDWRLVLSWDQKSRDLDSWLSFGTATQCNSEGCSGACEAGWSWPHEECSHDSMSVEATLERDFTWGFGPETMYIKGVGSCVKSPIQDCIIVYMVWNYTPDSAPLGKSGAKVAVFAGGEKQTTLEVPVETGDKVWYPVLTIDASNGKWYPGDHTEALIAANPHRRKWN